MKSKWLTATGLALGVVLLLAVNVFSSTALTSVRLDLTQNKLYTSTRNCGAQLPKKSSTNG